MSRLIINKSVVCALLLLCASSGWAEDPTVTNSANGTNNTATTNASFGFTATAGRLLVVTVGSDDYKTGDPSGYTLSTGMSQQTFLGSYVWWKIAAGGETSVSYTIGSASPSAWTVTEFDNVDATPYDISNGQLVASGATTYTTPSITPSTGRRLILAVIGGSRNPPAITDLNTWLNGYTEVNQSFNNSGATGDITGIAMLVMDGNGSTTTSSGATYSTTPDARTAHIISFNVASGGGGGGTASKMMLMGVGP